MRALTCFIRTTILLTAVGIPGCVDPEPPETGALVVNLAGQTSAGTVYRLRDAFISVSGPQFQSFFTEDNPNRTSLSADVLAGDYTLFVSGGWRLERVTGSSAQTVDAVLASDNIAFRVDAGARTSVPLRFTVGSDDVDMGQGFDVVIDVSENGKAGIVVTSPDAASFQLPAVAMFSRAANGATAPFRSITGPRSSLQRAQDVAVSDGEIFVVDQQANAIDVFATGPGADALPIRRIAGPSTGIFFPAGIAVVDGEIYVGVSDSLRVFRQKASGDVAPTRVISGVGFPRHFAIDDGELYVGDQFSARIRVFAADASGLVTPIRELETGFAPSGIAVHDGELFVAGDFTSSIAVYLKSSVGHAQPLRNLAQFFGPPVEQLAVFHGEIYGTTFNGIVVFPIGASSSAPPSRTITDPSLLGSPGGIAVF